MNYLPIIIVSRLPSDACEAIQHMGSVLNEDPLETSSGGREVADDEVSPETPLKLSPCCIVDSFKESCRSDHVILKIN